MYEVRQTWQQVICFFFAFHQPTSVNVCTSFFLLTKTTLQPQKESKYSHSALFIFMHSKIIIHKHVHRHRNLLQPTLRSPVTTGALSLISIFTAFQKVPNLFSFMLRSATRHNFSLFSSTSLSFPLSKKRKKKLDSQHSSHVLQICAKVRGKKLPLFSPLASPLLLPCMPVSSSTCSCSSGAGGGMYCGFKHP